MMTKLITLWPWPCEHPQWCDVLQICLFHFAFLLFSILGGVYFVSEGGTCNQSFKADGPILKLLYYEEKNLLITVTEGLSLFQHAVMPEGDTKEIMKVREWLFFRSLDETVRGHIALGLSYLNFSQRTLTLPVAFERVVGQMYCGNYGPFLSMPGLVANIVAISIRNIYICNNIHNVINRRLLFQTVNCWYWSKVCNKYYCYFIRNDNHSLNCQ